MFDKLKQALKELLTSKEKTVSDISSDAPPAPVAPITDSTVVAPVIPQPAPEVPAEVKAEAKEVETKAEAEVETKVEPVVARVVQDFEKAFNYVTHGISVLGEDAREDLMKLAAKFL